jgi:DNA-directed RNA polymerase specialized sigma24 family protein
MNRDKNRNSIKNHEAYVWQIAHNRYAKKIDGKNKRNKREFFSGDMFLWSVADGNFVEDEIVLREEYKSVFNALHSLSALYRDILVDYYVGEMYIQEIAIKYSLTKETVKWRLHVAKERIEERVNNMNASTEKIYKKLNWSTGGCNGSLDTNKYLGMQIYRAIAASCYEKPLDIEEISLKTGIPTLYLEEPLEHMIYGDAIEKIGNKYATNFIILFADDNKKMQKSVVETSKDLPKKVWDILLKALPEIKENLTYGKDFTADKLGYLFIPIFLRQIIGMEKIGPYPKRKDGGWGWMIVGENSDNLSPLECGQNNYYSEKNGINYDMHWYWFNKAASNLNQFFHKYDFAASYFDNNGVYINIKSDDELTAELLEYNIMRKDGAGYKSNIPVTTRNGEDKINSILNRYKDDIVPPLTELIKNIHNEYKRFVPERLNDQIRGIIPSYCGGIIPIIQDELVKSKCLRDYKNDEVFTDNVCFVVG